MDLVTQKKKYMFNLPLYGRESLQIAFEFGVVLSEVAKEKKIKLTSEITTRAEDILVKEIRKNGYKKTALNFIPLVLASLEV